MTISHTIWDFPNLNVKAQLLRVPGFAFEGGLTVGGARISSPEPGGRAVLEMQLSLATKERTAPEVSWLMSMTNGHIFKVLLKRTPQLVALPNEVSTTMTANAAALEGAAILTVNTGAFGTILKRGHVIGHDNYSYVIYDVSYAGAIATVKLSPALRKPVASGATIRLRPYFLGSIANGDEFKAWYEAGNNGHIETGRLLLHETVV